MPALPGTSREEEAGRMPALPGTSREKRQAGCLRSQVYLIK